MKDIESIVVGIVAEILNIPCERVTLNMAIGDLPQWGSMAQMGIVTAIQKRFAIEIPMEALFDLTTVSDFVDEVERLSMGQR